jgi:hypothetical protein
MTGLAKYMKNTCDLWRKSVETGAKFSVKRVGRLAQIPGGHVRASEAVAMRLMR